MLIERKKGKGLTTGDHARGSMSFYSALFGWVFKPVPGDGVEVFACGSADIEPIGALRKRTGILVGSARLQTYVNGAVLQWPVESVDRALSQAAMNGGEGARTPVQLSNGDWCARIVDSEGNHFTVREAAAKH
jgi:predicted enzyme related to lactoylglutathione lyase